MGTEQYQPRLRNQSLQRAFIRDSRGQYLLRQRAATEELRNLYYDTTLFYTNYQYLSSVQVLDSTKYSGFIMTFALLYARRDVSRGTDDSDAVQFER